MRIALLTDLHFGARQSSVVVMKHQQKFFNQQFFPYINNPDNHIEGVACLGDVFDARKQTNHLALAFARQVFFEPLDKTELLCSMLVGNHDAYFKDRNSVNALNLFLGDFPNVMVINQPTTLHCFGAEILALPWICKANYDASMNALDSSDAKIVFGHLELNGFPMYAGSPPMNHGMGTSKLDRFPLVLSGHYHHASRRNNIQYLGTPYEMTWSDYGDKKGFYVLDTGTLELKQIENPDHLFRVVVYDDTTSQDLPTASDMQDQYVKIVVQAKTQPVQFEEYMSSLEKSAPADLQVSEKGEDVVVNTGEVPDMDVADIEKYMLDLVDKYFPPEGNTEVMNITRRHLTEWYHASRQANAY